MSPEVNLLGRETATFVVNTDLLPVLKHALEIKETIAKNDVVIVAGETGSGKTTELPSILQDILGNDSKIAITQPRKLAASSVAAYVADKNGVILGEEVGYQVRFDDHTNEGTKINFMTDGILVRMMHGDPLLKSFDAVVVDEAHERSLGIDFTLGLLKRAQNIRKETGIKPLKIIVSSATLEKDKFSKYFDQAPVIEVPGRLYPVDVHYEDFYVDDYNQKTAIKVKEIVNSGKEGDVLVFMPGKREINETIDLINQLNLPILALPLHGEMSPDDQKKIFLPSNLRKIIVATNIAETSITVPQVKFVIDSGLNRQMEYDSKTGIGNLETEYNSKSGCTQRYGRAGRVAAGEVYCLYTKEDFDERKEFQIPEIQRSNLSNVVLIMKLIGIDDIESFDFIDSPSQENVYRAIKTLKTLGALDDKERITEMGRLMAEFPLEPRLSRMIIEAEKNGCTDDICTIAAFINNKSVFNRPKDKEFEADMAHRKFKIGESDFLTYLNVWNSYEKENYNNQWALNNFLNPKVLTEVRNIRNQLLQILNQNGIEIKKSKDINVVCNCVTVGLIENLMVKNGNYNYLRIQDKSDVFIHPSSSVIVNIPKFFVASSIVNTGSKNYANGIQKVSFQWILKNVEGVSREENSDVAYDYETDSVIKNVDCYMNNVFLGSEKKEDDINNEEKVLAFAYYLANRCFYSDEKFNFVKSNNILFDTLRRSYFSGETKFKKYPSYDLLEREYVKRLGTISSMKKLEEALQNGELNLHLKMKDFLNDSPYESENNNKERKDLRIDKYEEIFNLEQSDIEKIVLEEKTKDIGRWRLAIAALVSKGPKGFEFLLKSKITKENILDDVIAGMQKSVTEAETFHRSDFNKIKIKVFEINRDVKIYKQIIEANNNSLVKEFIGDDKDSRIEFRKRLFERLKENEKFLTDSNLEEEIQVVLEEMTE